MNSISRILGLENCFTDKKIQLSLIPLIINERIQSNDLDSLKNLKNEITNITFNFPSKIKPLHLACKLGNLDIVLSFYVNLTSICLIIKDIRLLTILYNLGNLRFRILLEKMGGF